MQMSLIYVSGCITPGKAVQRRKGLFACVCSLDTLQKLVLFWMYLRDILYKAD